MLVLRSLSCLFLLGLCLICEKPAIACGIAEPADWITEADPLYVRAAPADCASARQTPPEFTWPPYRNASRYTLALQFPDGHSESAKAAANWVAWPQVLPPGAYAWSVRADDADAAAPSSRSRAFTVSADALPFVLPDANALSARAAATARPRSLPVGVEDRLWRSDLASARRASVERLRARVADYRGTLVTEPRVNAASPASPPLVLQVQIAAFAETTRLLETGLAWVLARQPVDRDEAIRRSLAIAAWDGGGLTSYASNDSVAMEIAWTLALSYDWLYAELTADQRATLLQAISVRTGPGYAALAGPLGSFSRKPYDSHGVHALAQIAAIGALLTGESAQARTWLEGAAPLYAHYLSPWGPDDGGYANGTSYAVWDIDSMLFMWDVLRRTTPLDLAKKSWAQDFDRLFSYFLPPGAPAGLFGDGAEVKREEEWGRVSKAYAARVPSPLMRWYVGQLAAGELSLPWAMLAPPPPPAGALPPATPPATLLASTGWVAMHAALANPSPFSVYFKSSPFGSYNHGHADQNSFVIHANGEVLTAASGFYDWYASPHWRDWYAQTRAHNAITYDGGQGQMLGPRGDGLLDASGRVTTFSTSAPYDMTVGDATPAYGAGVTRAIRALVYLRPHTLVIFDDLAAATSRRWEWNLHAAHQFLGLPGDVHAINAATPLCFRVFAMDRTAYMQSEGFPVAPAQAPGAQQWHAVFQTPAAASARFISVFDTDCAGLQHLPQPVFDEGWMEIRISGKRIAFATGADAPTVLPDPLP